MKKNKIISIFMVLIILSGGLSVCLSGCQNEKNTGGTNVTGTSILETSDIMGDTSIAYPITIKDAVGREIAFDRPAERIVSSYYITTSILIAIGAENRIVGIEKKADTRELYRLAAPHMLSLPGVGTAKSISVEETAELIPDVVILPKKLKDSVDAFDALGIKVVVVDPETMDDFRICIDILGKITGSTEKSKRLRSYYDQKISYISGLTKGLNNKPKVYLSAGSGYLSTATSKMYQNDLIEMAGGINSASDLTDMYWAKVSAEQLLAWNPDYILAVSYAEYKISDIYENTSLSGISAIKNHRIFTFPSEIEAWDYPAASSVLGIMWLTQLLHPEIYSREEYIREAKDFYREFFDIDVTEAQLGI